jgi:hypothetical protein
MGKQDEAMVQCKERLGISIFLLRRASEIEALSCFIGEERR